MDQENEKKDKIIRSAYDSPTFDQDVSIRLGREVGSATISPSGRDVALASLDGLDIIDLDRPYTRPRHLQHVTSWSVADVQWSPFAARDYWVISTSYQKALVWNLTMSEKSHQGPIEHTLHSHSRAITDINFSAHHPDVLATCAVDGYVNCWDLRRPRVPCMTFVDWFAGATQVKWNRQDEHILASSHDRWLRIWDDRKGAYPLRSIEAHESKIYGLDWNRTRTNGIVTCSLDRSIKFWDYENPEDEPECVIKTGFPVWRARHTPFGWGLLAMPQDKAGDLHLYDRRLNYDEYSPDGAAPPAATFPGHGQNKVKEFLWRVRGSITDEGIDDRDFQLVSWGEDGELRLQHIDSTVLNSVGYYKGSQVRKRLIMTRKGAVYKSFCDVESVAEKQVAAITGPRPARGLKLQSSALGTNSKRMSPPKAFQGNMMPVVRDKHKRTSGNQIGWISGIRFNKKVEKIDPRTGSGRRFSILSPGYNLNDWDSPESLHEEIIRVHTQYSKVTFDDVNLDKRNVLVSLNGPWGSGGSTVFIKVNIDFPDQYPDIETPTFTLGNTSNISEELSQKIVYELHELAEGFIARKQGCLEAVLCYLLGEINLEESTTAWFKDTQSIDNNSDGLADESSSDDEDGDIPAGASAMMSQELDASGTGELQRNGNANVPLPRLCGAVFSRDDKLVCFFPPKEDKVKSLLSNLSVGMRATRGEKRFETFGRLKHESPGPRNNMSFIADESRYDSDSSEASYSSSSDSDSSPFPNFPVQYWRPRARSRRYLSAFSTNQSVRSSAAGTGTGTGTGTAFSKAKALKPKNIISIYDLEAFSPAEKALAKEYAIFGDGPDVCEKNAEVAARHGCQELSDIWKYVKLILLDDIPLEILTRDHVKEPILIVARDAIRRSRRSSRDSGVDVSDNTLIKSTGLSGRVKWGQNPLARNLISRLFHHFEHPAYIQMLAMLSCVFSEPAAEGSVSRSEMHLGQPATPMSMKTPAFSLDYFPSDSAAWNLTQLAQTPKVASPKPAYTPLGIFGSFGSNGLWGSDPHSGMYSTGDTPPGRSTPRGSTDLGHSNTHSLSTSPETSRVFRRANSSGLASSFAASFSRPFATTSSPPNRKRPSPVEAVLSSLAPANVTWGGKTILGSLTGNTLSEIPLESDEEKDPEDSSVEYNGISLTVEMQEIFDDEGCMSAPLLEVKHAARFASYRKAYAELLFIWGEHLSRLEILKFSGLPDYFALTEDGKEMRPFANNSYQGSITSHNNASTIEAIAPSSPIQLGKTHSTDKNKDDFKQRSGSVHHDLGVDITGYCLKHECRLIPIPDPPKTKSIRLETNDGAIGICERCDLTQRQLRCVICTEPITALYAPCLSCGCASHQHCLLAVHAAGETICAGGCDCDCVEKGELGVVESWDVMMGMINRGAGALAKGVAGAAGGYVSSGDDDGPYGADRDKDWDAENRAEWNGIPTVYVGNTSAIASALRRGIGPTGYRSPFGGSGSGMGPATAALLSTRLERVKAGDWGGNLRSKATKLRRESSFDSH